jgi:hypothetical protein
LKMLNCLVDGCTFKRTLGECLKLLKSILNFKMSRTVSNCIQESSRGCTSPDTWDFFWDQVCLWSDDSDGYSPPSPAIPVTSGPSYKSRSALRCSSACCCERWICCSSVWTLSRLVPSGRGKWLCPQFVEAGCTPASGNSNREYDHEREWTMRSYWSTSHQYPQWFLYLQDCQKDSQKNPHPIPFHSILLARPSAQDLPSSKAATLLSSKAASASHCRASSLLRSLSSSRRWWLGGIRPEENVDAQNAWHRLRFEWITFQYIRTYSFPWYVLIFLEFRNETTNSTSQVHTWTCRMVARNSSIWELSLDWGLAASWCQRANVPAKKMIQWAEHAMFFQCFFPTKCAFLMKNMSKKALVNSMWPLGKVWHQHPALVPHNTHVDIFGASSHGLLPLIKHKHPPLTPGLRPGNDGHVAMPQTGTPLISHVINNYTYWYLYI